VAAFSDSLIRVWNLEKRSSSRPPFADGPAVGAARPSGGPVEDVDVEGGAPAPPPAAIPPLGSSAVPTGVTTSAGTGSSGAGGVSGRAGTSGGGSAFGGVPLVPDVFVGHSTSVTRVGLSPDGTFIISGSLDGSIRLWRVDGKVPLVRGPPHARPLLSS
jgi:WD40 repeat protein